MDVVQELINKGFELVTEIRNIEGEWIEIPQVKKTEAETSLNSVFVIDMRERIKVEENDFCNELIKWTSEKGITPCAISTTDAIDFIIDHYKPKNTIQIFINY